MSRPIVDGSSLAGTNTADISQSMSNNRTCTIEITNHTEEALSDPSQYCHSGYCHNPLQPIVEPRSRDACAFSKNSDAACGSVGVISYRLGNSNVRFAIMFSVPYDYNFYENWFGLAFIDGGMGVDESLYDNMYNSSDWDERVDKQRATAKSGKTLHIERDGWRISATMSEAKRAIMHVEVTSRGGYSQQGPGPMYANQNQGW